MIQSTKDFLSLLEDYAYFQWNSLLQLTPRSIYLEKDEDPKDFLSLLEDYAYLQWNSFLQLKSRSVYLEKDEDPKDSVKSPRRFHTFSVEFVAHTTQRLPREKDEDPKYSWNLPEHKGFLESPRRFRIFSVEFVASSIPSSNHEAFTSRERRRTQRIREISSKIPHIFSGIRCSSSHHAASTSR